MKYHRMLCYFFIAMPAWLALPGAAQRHSPPAKPLRIILVGDSTMAPNGGYGDALCQRLHPQVACLNQGRAERSFEPARHS